MKKVLILSAIIGVIIVSSYFYLNNNYLANSKHNNHDEHEEGLVHAVLDYPTDQEVLDKAELILIGITKNYQDVVMTPGDIPFTKVDFKVQEVISNENNDIPKDITVFHEGAEDYFYESFRLPEKGMEYLIFLEFSEELGRYQIKYPNSKFEIMKVNGNYRIIEPALKKELELLHGHKNYEEMDEFKDDVYVTSKSTGEKVKLTATEKLSEKVKKIKLEKK